MSTTSRDGRSCSFPLGLIRLPLVVKCDLLVALDGLDQSFERVVQMATAIDGAERVKSAPQFRNVARIEHKASDGRAREAIHREQELPSQEVIARSGKLALVCDSIL